MSILMPKTNEFESVPAGTYSAACYRVIDLGTQYSEFYQKASHKIMIGWELDEKMKDGKPFSVHKRYTLSSGKNAQLRKDLESWRGVAFSDHEFGTFDIGVLLGIGCMIGITQDSTGDKTYSNVTSIMRLPKNSKAIPVENEILYFSLSDFKQDIYNKLSEGLQAIIAKSPEYQELKGSKATEAQITDAHDHTPETDSPF